MSIMCIWDGMFVERESEDRWISKSWAMKGPRGSMMNKEIPQPYLAQLESDYQKALSGEKYPRCKIIGEKDGEILKPVKQVDESEKSLTKNPQKKSKNKGLGSFNPFEKKNEI